MMRQTGGSALGATSTKSKPCSRARRTASRVSMTPNCSPSSPMTRTSGTRILSLMRAAGCRRLSGRWPRPRKPVAIAAPPSLESSESVESIESGESKQLSYSLDSLDPLDSLDFVINRTCPYKLTRLLFELCERHHSDVAPGSFTHGDLAFFHLAVAENEHERNFLHLR